MSCCPSVALAAVVIFKVVRLCLSLQCVSFSPLWLHRPVFFPHWNYIPYNASGRGQTEAGGHVELIGSPVLLCPAPEQRMDLIRAVGVSEAAGFLSSRFVCPLIKTKTLCVKGGSHKLSPCFCLSDLVDSVWLSVVMWVQCALCSLWQEPPSSASH